MRKLVLAWMIPAVACAATLQPDVKNAVVPFPFDEWDALLKKYVDAQGRVDYNRLRSDPKLEQVYASVAATAPDKLPSRAAKEAFYLNAYNVCVWKNVVTRPNLKNVDSEKASFFYFTKFVVGGKEMNLQDLESKIIRPTFKDPRVHFALNCASGGCPQLPPSAFVPEKLEQQLEREARKFVNEKRNVDYDPATKKLKLSHIFDWYKEDFGNVIAWINHYRQEKVPADAKVDYVDYDWTLNDVNLLKR